MDKINKLIEDLYARIGPPVDVSTFIGLPNDGPIYAYRDIGVILLFDVIETLKEQQNKINELSAQIHAKWEDGDGRVEHLYGNCDDPYEMPTYRCSACKCEEEYASDYCPNCGARMDGDMHEAN